MDDRNTWWFPKTVLLHLPHVLLLLKPPPHVCQCTGRSIYIDSKLKMDNSVRNAVALFRPSVVESSFAGGTSVVTIHIKCRNRPSQPFFRSFNTFAHTWAEPHIFNLQITELIVKPNYNADRCQTKESEQQGETVATGFTINVFRG